jgi:hypothetical protein
MPKGACLAGVGFHLFLILTVCCRDTFVALAQGDTVLPRSFDSYWEKPAKIATAMLGRSLTKWNPVRQGLGAYLDVSGIETGYGFFAPHVPRAYKLVFELHYSDGRVEYETPRVETSAGELRLATLLDQIGWVENADVRQGMIKLLAYVVWRDHPDVSMIRAIFGAVNVPTAAEFERGRKESSYQVLSAYDITREPKRGRTTQR